ncbi:MAG: hypothetical protein R2793_10310 [Flavobacteriaceae bacterium]
MKILKSIFSFYIESSIHVALAVTAFTLVSFIELGISIDTVLLIFVFLGTITGYNFIKYAGIAGLHHRRLTQHLKKIQVFSLGCFLGLVYTFFWVPWVVWQITFLLGLLTLLYAVPFLHHKNLRSFHGLKIFPVALVWAGVSVWLPWALGNIGFTWDVVIVFVQRMLWVLALIIPFEIRDLVHDDPALGTLPQQLGVRKTKQAGWLFLGIILILEGFLDEVIPWFSLCKFFFLVLTAIFIAFSEKNQKNYYAAFWVEATPIFYVVLVVAFEGYFSIS